MPKTKSNQDKAKEAHRAAKEAFHMSAATGSIADIKTLNSGIARIAKKVVPLPPPAALMSGKTAFEDVREYMDKAVASLNRAEYKVFLDEMGGVIQSYQDCFDAEEEKEGV